jgi:Rod binding domain-containing protein
VSDGLPPIDQSLIPAGVRAGGSKDVQLYEAALSFESMLTQQLTKSLTDTLQPSQDDSSDDSGDGSSSDAGTTMTLSMLPQALSQDLEGSGGLGLAPQLYQALGGTMSPTAGTTPTTGTGAAK